MSESSEPAAAPVASIAARAARGAVWGVAGGAISRGVGLLGTLVLFRLLAPAEYGEVVAAVAAVAFVNQLATLGVGPYVVAHRDADRAEIFHATFLHLTSGLIGLGVLLVAGQALGAVLAAPALPRYVLGLALAMLIDRIGFVPQRLLVRDLAFRRVALIQASGEIVYPVVAVALAAAGWGAIAIVLANLARASLRTTLLTLSVDRREWLEWSRLEAARAKRIVRYSSTLAVGSMASLAADKGTVWMVRYFFGPAACGMYGAAFSLAEVPAVQIGEQITDVVLASFASMSEHERRRVLLRALGVLALIMFPIGLGLSMVAPSLEPLVFRGRWADASQLLAVLAVMSLARPLTGALCSFVLVQLGPRLVVLLDVIEMLAVLATVATVGQRSPMTAGAAIVSVGVARVFATMFIARTASGIQVRSMVARIAGPLLACAPMVLAVRLAGAYLPAAPWPVSAPLVVLAVQILVGAIVYPAAAMLVAPSQARDFLDLVRRALARRRHA